MAAQLLYLVQRNCTAPTRVEGLTSRGFPTEGRHGRKRLADTPPEKNGSSGYGAQDITVLEGLEAVRKRPGMYIGSTGIRGLPHLIYEVMDNSVDEALAGEADTVDITIHPDNRVTVTDNGRGIPVDIM